MYSQSMHVQYFFLLSVNIVISIKKCENIAACSHYCHLVSFRFRFCKSKLGITTDNISWMIQIHLIALNVEVKM